MMFALGRGPLAPPRPSGVRHTTRIAVSALAICALGVAGLGARRLWWLHDDDAILRSAIGTAITLAMLLAAALFAGRARHTRALRDVLIAFALGLASLSEFAFDGLPVVHWGPAAPVAGGRMAIGLLIAAGLAAAAWTPPGRTVADVRRGWAALGAGATAWIALGATLGRVGRSAVASAAAPAADHRASSVAVALIVFLALAAAAWGFAARGRRGGSQAGVLATGALLLGLAHVSEPALSLVPPGWMTPADALRVAACAALLLAAVRLGRDARAEAAHDALAAERRRIARDLHDSLAQDLALIGLHSERLAREYGADHPLATAARRALAVSRGQIVDLEAARAPTTAAAVREVAGEFSARYGVEVTVDEAAGAGAPALRGRERAQLVRIAREAMANAVRHGRAGRIDVRLGSGGEAPLLRVSDDGCGFAGAGAGGATAGTGLGMGAMRERAQLLGAELSTGVGVRGGAQIEVLSSRGSRRPDC